jgi:hypothetical protein
MREMSVSARSNKIVNGVTVYISDIGPSGWNSTAPGQVSFHVRRGAGEGFQYLGAYNESNPQNAFRTPNVLKKMSPS